jgi:hypothetical protein
MFNQHAFCQRISHLRQIWNDFILLFYQVSGLLALDLEFFIFNHKINCKFFCVLLTGTNLILNCFTVLLHVIRLHLKLLLLLLQFNSNLSYLKVLDGFYNIFEPFNLLFHYKDLFLQVLHHKEHLWWHLCGSNKLLNCFLNYFFSGLMYIDFF